MQSITLYNWNNPDLEATSGYTTSYTIKRGNSELFNVNLYQQGGFFQMSEFVAPHGRGNFIIEQINKSRRPKIAAFDKDSGAMLGILKEDVLFDLNEAEVFQLRPIAEVIQLSDYEQPEGYPDDWMAVVGQDQASAAIFARLPAPSDPDQSSISRLRGWLENLSHKPKAVMRIDISRPEACELRMFCAVAVIIHSRRGILRSA